MDLEQVNPWSRNRFIRGFRRGFGASVLVFRIPSLPKLRYRAHPKWGELTASCRARVPSLVVSALHLDDFKDLGGQGIVVDSSDTYIVSLSEY